MANAWREHVKKTMVKMKAEAKGKTVMLKDVLKAAGKTYKKSGDAAVKHSKTTKKRLLRERAARKRAARKRLPRERAARERAARKNIK